jgi:hypothetical protein
LTLCGSQAGIVWAWLDVEKWAKATGRTVSSQAFTAYATHSGAAASAG